MPCNISLLGFPIPDARVMEKGARAGPGFSVVPEQTAFGRPVDRTQKMGWGENPPFSGVGFAKHPIWDPIALRMALGASERSPVHVQKTPNFARGTR